MITPAEVSEADEVAEVQDLVSRATWVDLRKAEFPHDGPTLLEFPVQRFERPLASAPSKPYP